MTTVYATSQNNSLNRKVEIKDLAFMEGKWKARAQDSSFSSILKYEFSKEGKLLLASNHLYGKGDRFLVSMKGHIYWMLIKSSFFSQDPKVNLTKELS